MSILKEKRERLGIPKTVLARLLGVSRPTYDRYEKDPLTMSGYQIKEVCDFLGYEPAVFFCPEK